MDDQTETASDFDMRRIIDAANDFMRDHRSSQKIRRELLGHVQSLVSFCEEADSGRSLNAFDLLQIASAAFAIGAIAGKPSMVTGQAAGRRSAGGIKSGATRRKTASVWRSHATELMRQIRMSDPSASQEKVAERVTDLWKLSHGPPGASALIKLLRELENSGAVASKKKD